MPTPTERYESQRATYVERTLCWLADVHRAEPEVRCVAESALRSFLHASGGDAWLKPVIGILRDRGLIEIRAGGVAGQRTLYFTERFVNLAEGPKEETSVP